MVIVPLKCIRWNITVMEVGIKITSDISYVKSLWFITNCKVKTLAASDTEWNVKNLSYIC